MTPKLSVAQRRCLFAVASTKHKPQIIPWYGTTLIVAGTAEHVELNTVRSLVRLGYFREVSDKFGRRCFQRFATRRKRS